MAGTAFDRKLERPDRTRFAIASRADEAAIRRLLRDNPMRGAISLAFEREPDYFCGAGLAGADDRTIVAFLDEKLACMGRCIERECWVNGRETRVGYLAELRLDKGARGRVGIIRDGYHFFHALQRDDPAELHFTSIAADNARALRLLGRGARGLPAYAPLAELETVLVAVPRRSGGPRLQVESATPERIPELLRLLNDSARKQQLAAVWTAERLLSLGRHGMPLHRFLTASEGGDLVACGALWDQRAFRQTVIRSYSKTFGLARPLVNAAGRVFGWPRLPLPGSTLAHAFLSPLAFASGAEVLLTDFIQACFGPASQSGIEFLTLALPAQDERLRALRRRFPTRTWRSCLYRVDWPGPPASEIGGNFLPDVALL
jgi:hypothetical protein